MSTLQKDPLYSVSNQAEEYVYLSKEIASLPHQTMKSLRKKKDTFCRKQKPTACQYSPSLSSDCLWILEEWFKQKQIKVPEEYLDKFRIETDVCRNAIKRSLPLLGVVAYVDGSPVGFSLGGEHSKSCFNCMFEKTDLSYDGLSVFVFSELAEMLKNQYALINAGEDWGIPYLKETKLKWQPIQIQKSYRLDRNAI